MSETAIKSNTLYYGDNLSWLRDHDYFPNDSVDLIYLDPPFNSNADYNVIFKEQDGRRSESQLHAFGDTWRWNSEASELALERLSNANPDIANLIKWLGSQGDSFSKSTAAYLGMMATRLIELHRALKSTGSLYLHCDPTASHYLKLLLDQIFGAKNFQNEFIWYYSGGGASKKRWARKHDTILFYSKSNEWVFNADAVRTPHKWTKGQHRADGSLRDYQRGKLADDVWEHHSLMPWSLERSGYETQKPQKLLERIISASSRKGEVVLDPFCGCGTTIVASQKLHRKWIGIDITHLAIFLVEKRLRDSFGETVASTYDIKGNPNDIDSAQVLWNSNTREFELWALSLVGAKPRPRNGGVDGVLGFYDKDRKVQKIVVQVKGGETLTPSFVRDLMGTVENEKAAIGLLITLHSPTSGMTELAVHSKPYKSEFWQHSYPSIQIRTVKELLIEGKKFDLPPEVATFKQSERIREQGHTETML